MLGFTAPASAQSTTYTCTTVPTLSFSDIVIEQTGDCTLTKKIEARSITINIQGSIISSNGDIKATTGSLQVFTSGDMNFTTGTLFGGTVVKLDSGGLINVAEDVISNVKQDPNLDLANILIQANGNISIRRIKTSGKTAGPASPRSGAVQIDANRFGGAVLPFVIGQVSNNGVSEFIDTRSVDGGGTDLTFTKGGVRITNGDASSTAGITVKTSNSLRVENSNSKSGWIILNAQKGVITLEGNLTSDGPAGKGAGNIFLFANTVMTQGNIKVSASQDDSVASGHQILISAGTLQYAGTGLQVKADGRANPSVVSIYIVPDGNVIPISSNNISALLWTFQQPTPLGQLNKVLNVTGSDLAPLKITANGNDAQILVSGYPMYFVGGDLTIQANGSANQKITMGYFGSFEDKDGLIFQNTGKVLIDASAINGSGNAGIVYVSVDKSQFNPTKTTFKSSVPTGGSGKGGDLYFISKMINQLENQPRIEFIADGGNGLGGNIFFQTENNTADLRLGNGDFSFSAKGGASSTGQGSNILILNNSPSVLTRVLKPKMNEPIIDVSASSGNGGFIKIAGSANVALPDSQYPQQDFVALDARGSANGGYIYFGTPDQTGRNVNNRVNLIAALNVKGESGMQGTGSRIGVDVDGSQPIFCVQRKVGNGNDWPKSYWNCASPDNPSPEEFSIVEAAQSLPNEMKELLGNSITPSNPDIQIFVMGKIIPSYFKYFFLKEVGPSDLQYGISNTRPNRVSTAFTLVELPDGSTVSAVAASGSSTIVKGTIVHELGHNVDWTTGSPSVLDPTFDSNFTADWNALNSKTCSTVFFQSTCDQYPNKTNQQIFAKRFPGIESNFLVKPANKDFFKSELFAAMFEHVIGSTASPQYQVEPELEFALDAFTGVKAFMDTFVHQSHAKVN